MADQNTTNVQTEPVAPDEAQPQNNQPDPEPEVLSDDEREYREVMEEIEQAERAAAGGGDPDAGQQADTTGEAGSDTDAGSGEQQTSTEEGGDTGDDADDADQAAAGEQDTERRRRNDFIPKKQYDRQIAKRRAAEAELARLKAKQEVLDDLIAKGVLRGDGADAAQDGSDTSGQQNLDSLPPEQRLEALERQLDTLEAQYEEGELDVTQAEYRTQRNTLRAQIRQTEREALRADLMRTTPLGESPTMREESDRLEREAAPWVRTLEGDYPEHVELAQRRAVLEARRTHRDASEEEFITEARRLAYQFGREEAERLGIIQVGQHQEQSSPRGNGQAGSDEQVGPTPEQRRAKVETAQRHPPNMSQLGGRTEAGAGSLTEEEILAMDPDELAELPEKELAALGGRL